MENTLLGAGVACVIAAIVGGGLKAFGVEIGVLRSLPRQLLLASFGLALIVASGITKRQISHAPTPSAVPANPQGPPPEPHSTEYPQEFEAHKTNEIQLARDGETAFARGHYAWAIKFLTQAKRMQTSGVWQSYYPYLYGAQLAAGQSSDAARTRAEMLDAVKVAVTVGNRYLSHQPPLGMLLTNLGTVQRSLGEARKDDFDDLINQVSELKQKAN